MIDGGVLFVLIKSNFISSCVHIMTIVTNQVYFIKEYKSIDTKRNMGKINTEDNLDKENYTWVEYIHMK